MRRHLFWPTNAIALGIWEVTAFATGKRVPTITTAAKYCVAKRKRTTTIVVTLWAVSLWRHLVLGKEI